MSKKTDDRGSVTYRVTRMCCQSGNCIKCLRSERKRVVQIETTSQHLAKKALRSFRYLGSIMEEVKEDEA